jgi:hypothetical protein
LCQVSLQEHALLTLAHLAAHPEARCHVMLQLPSVLALAGLHPGAPNLQRHALGLLANLAALPDNVEGLLGAVDLVRGALQTHGAVAAIVDTALLLLGRMLRAEEVGMGMGVGVKGHVLHPPASPAVVACVPQVQAAMAAHGTDRAIQEKAVVRGRAKGSGEGALRMCVLCIVQVCVGCCSRALFLEG